LTARIGVKGGDAKRVLSDFARGEPAVMARLRQEAPMQLAVSAITQMEVEYGLARNPNLAPRVREAMRMLLNAISAFPFEREDARVAAIARKPEQPRYAYGRL
jgi:tRNA(fMet)-specific endonuclease VapC